MAIHLVCYADDAFRHAQDRLVASARTHGVDVVHRFRPADFRDDPFFVRHAKVLSAARGAGYCLWKPYVIAKVLREARADDFVLYADCGATLASSPQPLVDVCRAAGGVLLFRNHGRQNRYWVKRDCYVLMRNDTPDCHVADQVNAAFSGFMPTAGATELLEEWLAACTDPRILTDAPNVCGVPDLPEFVVHMYDQSVLSVLAHRRNIFLHRDPTIRGSHLKPPPLRSPGEPIELPYAPEPYPSSPYPTLFDHHRNTAPAPSALGALTGTAKRFVRKWAPRSYPNPYFEPADVALAARRNRAALREVPTWVGATDAAPLSRHGSCLGSVKEANLRVGDQPTLTDLLVNLADHLRRPLEYFELGVGVGKNFFQVLRSARGGRLTGLDVTDAPPSLSRRLTPKRSDEWRTSQGSHRRDGGLVEFEDTGGRNVVRHFSTDCFDEQLWARLAGTRFNCLFLDAAHWPVETWTHTWIKLREFDLIDRDEFVIVWDDLGGYLSLVFERAAADLASAGVACTRFIVQVRGIHGVNEHPHQVGVVARMRQPPLWFRRAERAGLMKVVEPANRAVADHPGPVQAAVETR